MSKVFVITSGSYSDYSVYGVSLTREAAQKIIDSAQAAKDSDGDPILYWAEDARIEEYDTEDMTNNVVFTRWHVGMFLDDGSIAEPSKGGENSVQVWEVCRRSEVTQLDVPVPMYGNRRVVRVWSSVSHKHAVKVAAEKRQEWLRANAIQESK